MNVKLEITNFSYQDVSFDHLTLDQNISVEEFTQLLAFYVEALKTATQITKE